MSWQTPRGSALPAAIDVHLPSADASAQLRQAPVQAVSQQMPSTHLNGLQFCTPCGRHVPRPSQVPGVLRRVPVQEGAMHWVSAAYFSQPPKPSQVPVVPHDGAPLSLQTARGSGTP